MKKFIKFILILLIVIFVLLTVLSLVERSGSQDLSDEEKAVLETADSIFLRVKELLGGFGDDAENLWFQFKGSISGWKIKPSEAIEKIEQGVKCVLLDVQSAEEYNQSHIPESVSLPLPELEERAEEVIGDKSVFVFVYGATRKESSAAVKKLRGLGYKNALDLGSIDDWPYELLIG
jgi:rhodanese-related sulfurtransferase